MDYVDGGHGELIPVVMTHDEAVQWLSDVQTDFARLHERLQDGREREAWRALGFDSFYDLCEKELLKEMDFTRTQRQILAITLSEAGLSQRESAALLGSSAASVNRDLARARRAAARGEVALEPDEDKRVGEADEGELVVDPSSAVVEGAVLAVQGPEPIRKGDEGGLTPEPIERPADRNPPKDEFEWFRESVWDKEDKKEARWATAFPEVNYDFHDWVTGVRKPLGDVYKTLVKQRQGGLGANLTAVEKERVGQELREFARLILQENDYLQREEVDGNPNSGVSE